MFEGQLTLILQVRRCRVATYKLEVWHSLVRNLFKLPHDHFEVILIQLFRLLGIEFLKPLLVVVVHIIRTSHTILDRRREPDQGRRFSEGTAVELSVVLNLSTGIGRWNIECGSLASCCREIGSRDGGLQVMFLRAGDREKGVNIRVEPLYVTSLYVEQQYPGI